MIERTVFLACDPDRAFALFTAHASDWWPEGMRHTADPSSRISMLPDGRFYERAGDGAEVELGRVVVWEPSVRLIFDFYPGTGPERPTEVKVRFAAEGDGTRVVVEHRATAASGELWDAGAPRFAQAWEQVLAALGDATDR